MFYLLLCGVDQWPFAEGRCNCIITGSQVHLPFELYIALFIHSYQLFIFFFLNIEADYTEAKKIQGSFQSW